ncbi:hypothetical protein M0804_005810 [Polistes exclamans]|nr:hypothetical protein M0804_005810 [Polistes exclamans]
MGKGDGEEGKRERLAIVDRAEKKEEEEEEEECNSLPHRNVDRTDSSEFADKEERTTMTTTTTTRHRPAPTVVYFEL